MCYSLFTPLPAEGLCCFQILAMMNTAAINTQSVGLCGQECQLSWVKSKGHSYWIVHKSTFNFVQEVPDCGCTIFAFPPATKEFLLLHILDSI